MFCTFLADRIFDGIFHCLKLFLGQLAKALDVFDFLNLSQSSLALAAALVVFGVAKAAFFSEKRFFGLIMSVTFFALAFINYQPAKYTVSERQKAAESMSILDSGRKTKCSYTQ